MSTFDLSNFLASFYDEAKERLSSIDHSLVQLEENNLDDEGLVSLRRDAHTIKGSALMLGVTDIGSVAHLFEDVIEKVIETPSFRTPKMTEFLYRLHDELAKRIQNPDDDSVQIDADALRQQYHELEQALSNDTGDTLSDVVSSTVKDDQELIGAEDVHAWKQQPKEDNATDQLLVDEVEAGTQIETLEQSNDSFDEPLSPLPMAIDLDDFSPDISHLELQQSAQRKSSGSFLRVDAQRIEDLSSFVVELSTTANQTTATKAFGKLLTEFMAVQNDWQRFNAALPNMNKSQVQQASHVFDESLQEHSKRIKRLKNDIDAESEYRNVLLKDLRNQVFALMLRPIDNIFSAFPRAVRDIAMRMNKKVKLQVGGKSLELDQSVSEMLVEPLVHLLNNAVAHGIESPEERIAAGKPEEGRITIMARQSGNEIIIEVVDDGQGLDTEVIKRVAVEKGVTTQAEADQMGSAGILEMIFRPGFSTKKEVDTVSGRGIGMNVVQDVVRKLTGSIRIHSVKGKGTRFILSLPVSIAVQNALIFRTGHRRYGILSHLIEQTVPLATQKIYKEEGQSAYIQYGGFNVPIVDLRKVLNDNSNEGLSKSPYIVITEHIEGFVGIIVDELIDNVEIVVRGLDPYLKRYQPQGVMGTTITSDGSVLLLLEPYGIKEMGRTSPDEIDTPPIESVLSYKVLLVEDSLIAREVEKAAFESLGLSVETAIDGMDALEKLDETFDIVVTDLEMPRLDGFGLVRRIRNRSEYDELPIMIISSRESPEDRMRAMDAGADNYLVKQHLTGENLLATLQSLLGEI